MRRLSITTRAWPLLLLALAVSFAACRTQEKAVRTEYRYIHTHDSVRVEKWDTVRVEIKGDTVRIFEKLHEREYFSTIYRDTLRMSDTLRIERNTVAATGNGKPIKRWRWFLFGAVLSFIVIFAARILIKVYLKK